MASFCSHGFASWGGSSKKGKKKSEEEEEEEEGIWVQVVDGRGQMNWQHSVTGAFWGPFHPAPVQHVVGGGAFAVQPVQPIMAQPVYHPAIPLGGVNVVPVSPMAVAIVVDDDKRKKKKGGVLGLDS